MDGLTPDDVRTLFERFGERWHRPLVVDLIGGSALAFLGSSRSTLDIDYIGSDIHSEGWQVALGALAAAMRLDRGTNTDIEDVVFLLRRSFINADELAVIVEQTLPNAAQYDIRPSDLRRNFATLMRFWKELK